MTDSKTRTFTLLILSFFLFIIHSPVQCPFSITFLTTNVSCNGAATGSINLTVSGGTPVYQYNWSNGSTQEDLINGTTGNCIPQASTTRQLKSWHEGFFIDFLSD